MGCYIPSRGERIEPPTYASKAPRYLCATPRGGRERIRTSGAINTVVFKTTALNHSATLPYCNEFLHSLELFFKIIEQLIVVCQDIVSINLGSVISPPIPYNFFTLLIDLKAFVSMQVTFILGI